MNPLRLSFFNLVNQLVSVLLNSQSSGLFEWVAIRLWLSSMREMVTSLKASIVVLSDGMPSEAIVTACPVVITLVSPGHPPTLLLHALLKVDEACSNNVSVFVLNLHALFCLLSFYFVVSH